MEFNVSSGLVAKNVTLKMGIEKYLTFSQKQEVRNNYTFANWITFSVPQTRRMILSLPWKVLWPQISEKSLKIPCDNKWFFHLVIYSSNWGTVTE